ncbi:MAG: FAD-dependent oxidoreductase [Syntrophobacteraceae bacterium]
MGRRTKTAVVIGGGPAGIEAALRIAQAGYKALLVEKEPELGGTLKQLCSSFPRWEDPQELLDCKIQELQSCPKATIRTNTVVAAGRPNGNSYILTLSDARDGQTDEVVADAVVLATGFELMDISIYGEYGYGVYPDVVNALEFEATLKEWKLGRGKPPKGVALIKCVGSRDRSKGNPYCSKICCMYTAKQAGMVKELFPEAKVYVFYMDYRAAGKHYEEFVREVIEDRHVRYVRGRPAKVLCEEGRLLVRAEDTLLGLPVEVLVDIVVLASAVVPRPATRRLAEMFGANTDEYGFIEPDRFNPVQAAARTFFAGGCGFAVETPLALQQGGAAAANVIALFNLE